MLGKYNEFGAFCIVLCHLYEGLMSLKNHFGEGHPSKSSSEPSSDSWSQNLAYFGPYQVIAVGLVPIPKALVYLC